MLQDTSQRFSMHIPIENQGSVYSEGIQGIGHRKKDGRIHMKRKFAERDKGTNTSGIMQDFFPRVSSFFVSCINDMKWKWLMFELKLLRRSHNKIRKNYCRKGWHKLQKSFYQVTAFNHTKKVEFLCCPYCNYKFFSTMKDKQLYLDLNSNKRNRLKKALMGMKGKRGNHDNKI